MPERTLGTRRDAGAARAWMLGPVAACCIALQYPGRPAWSGMAIALWLVSAALLDRTVLRRMWQPRFLAISALLALLSGLLLGTPQARVAGIPVSWTGVEAGVVMLLRGLLIVGIGTWGARWLVARAERLRAAGSSPVSAAAATALGLVPELGSRIRAAGAGPASRQRGLLQGLERAAVSLLCDAALLAEGLHRQAGPGERDG
jgi:hypothetical protein